MIDWYLTIKIRITINLLNFTEIKAEEVKPKHVFKKPQEGIVNCFIFLLLNCYTYSEKINVKIKV